MVQAIDQRIAPVLVESVRRGVGDAFAMRVAAARQAFVDGPDRGSAPLLAVVLAAPWSVDADTRRVLEDHLRQRYEIEAPAALIP
jgi:hypothetical protein